MSKESLPPPGDAAGRIALLVDADNISHAKLGAIVGELSRYGVANVRRAYGDWTNATLKGWKDKLHLFAIRPMQQFSYSVGKNATDMALERFAVRRNHLTTRKSRYNKSLERRVRFLNRA